MRRTRAAAALLGVCTLVVGIADSSPAAYVRPGITERVSLASDGSEGRILLDRAESWDKSSVSAGGRYVAFESTLAGLVAVDANQSSDIFVRDRKTGRTELISTGPTGTPAVGACPADNPPPDVPMPGSFYPSITPGGRYVAFQSCSANLVPDDTNEMMDVFLHDRRTGSIRRVSVGAGGAQARPDVGSYGGSFVGAHAISANGRYVVFDSTADNLVKKDSNDASTPDGSHSDTMDTFVYDRKKRTTRRVSVASDGSQGVADPVTGQGMDCCWWLYDYGSSSSISANGRHVAFTSDFSNLVPGDTNRVNDVFVHSLLSGKTRRVSIDSSGEEGEGAGLGGGDLKTAIDISADGRYAAFATGTRGLVPNDAPGMMSVYVHDRQNGRTERVCRSPLTDRRRMGITQVATSVVLPSAPTVASWRSRAARATSLTMIEPECVPSRCWDWDAMPTRTFSCTIA